MNAVFAGYVPGTGILAISQQFGSPADPPCSIILSRDKSGNVILSPGDSGTTVDSQTGQVNLGPASGLLHVNCQFQNNGYVAVIQDFDGSGADLNVTAGLGTCMLSLQGTTVFDGFHFRTRGASTADGGEVRGG